MPTGGWAGRNLTAVFSLSLNLSLSLLLLLGKRCGQEGGVPLYLPLRFLPCIWNIPAQTIHGSDSLGEMRFYNPGYQGDPLFTKIDESCGASRHLLPCSELCASFLSDTVSPPGTTLFIHPGLGHVSTMSGWTGLLVAQLHGDSSGL